MTRSAVERLELAPGLEISRLVTGLWQVADAEREGTLDPAAAARDLEPYLEAGLTTFDMADHYGSAEVIVGALGRREGKPTLQALTKWVPQPGPLSRAQARAAVGRALERLGRDRIDLLQFHPWCYWHPGYLDGLFHLEELRREGLIGHLGLTNCDAAHLDMIVASGIEIITNQVCFSLIDSRPLGPLRRVCEARGVRLLAYGTLAGGFLSERWLGQEEPEPRTWSQMKYKRFIDLAGGWQAFQRLLSALHDVAERHGASMANVASHWVLDQPHVAGVIIGARPGRRQHIDDNRRLFELRLDASSREALDAARAELLAIPGDSGDEYRHPPFLTASGDLSHHLEEFPLPFDSKRGADGRQRVFSGTSWEDLAGYCRAVRQGSRIVVSGTTASHGDRLIGGTSAAAQTHFVIDKIEGALHSLGSRLEDVVRTRVFVRDATRWEEVARAHGSRFDSIRPANSLVEARLIGDEYLVEIEAEALVASS